MNITAKISSNGQVTIPKKIRKILNSETIEFIVDDTGIRLQPVLSVEGALTSYAREKKPFSEIRDEVWGKVAEVL